MGVLDGKVVLVTGAANGIGRECALLAAAEGASVVVNDLGATVTGATDETAPSAAHTVADILAVGGKAVANNDSVADYDAVAGMVEQAVQSFGRLDAVINPAGFLRDGMFHKMTPENWDAVVNVHLRGAFNISRAAINLFREQNGGAFVHFASTTGLIGNLAQANYAAAKLGVVGLSRSIAMEGARANVRSNVIAPFAWTRMTATIPVVDEASAQRVERFRTGMRSDQVARFAVALCADGASTVSGQIFAVRGNEIVLFDQPRPVSSVTQPSGWSPASIIEHALPALGSKFTDLRPSADTFPYDPV